MPSVRLLINQRRGGYRDTGKGGCLGGECRRAGVEKERSGRAARDAGFKEAAEYIRSPIVRRRFNNSRRVRVNSVTTTSSSCRNL